MPAQPESYAIASGEVLSGGRRRYGELGAFITSLSSGQWGEYTGVNINATETSGPSGTARSWLEGEANMPVCNWPGKIAFDPVNKLLIGVGTTNGYISENPTGAHSKNIIFDLAANAFSCRWNPVGRSYGHFYDTNSSRPLGGYFYARGYLDSRLRKMDTTTREWSESYSFAGLAPSIGTIGAVDVHPSLGAQGSVMFLESSGRLIRFNVADGVRSVLGTYSGLGNYPLIHYVPALDAVIFGGGESGTAFYKLSSAGVVTQFSTALPVTVAANGAGGPFVPDPSGRPYSWLFADIDSTLRYIDWTDGSWHTVGTPPAALSGRFDTSLGASLTGLGAIALLTCGGRVSGFSTSKFWIYKV